MKIQLYNSNAPSNQLDKSSFLTLVTELEGSLRSPCSVLSPKIIVKYNGYLNINYMYIEEFGRYYFVNDVVSLRNNLWVVSGEVDVLMSYKDKLLEHSAIVKRSNISTNNYLQYDKYVPLAPIMNEEVDYINSGIDLSPTSDNFCGVINIIKSVDILSSVTPSYNKDGWTIPSGVYNPCDCSTVTYVIKNRLRFASSIGFLASDSSYATRIASAYIIPFNIPDNILSTKEEKIFPDLDLYAKKLLLHNYPLTFKINSKFKSNISDIFYYEPNSKYDIYIPYYGFIDISYRYLRYELSCMLSIDYTNGEAQLSIRYSGGFIKTVNFTLGQPVPISISGVGDVARKSEAYYIRYQAQIDYLNWSSAASVVSSLTGGIANVSSSEMGIESATDNFMSRADVGDSLSLSRGSTFTGALNALGGVVATGLKYAGNLAMAKGNYEANEVLNVPYGVPNNVTSILNMLYLYNSFFIRRTYSTPLISQSVTRKYKGIPINEELSLSKCRGYTVITDIVLNIPNITNTEINALVQMLYSGVRFPDSSSN